MQLLSDPSSDYIALRFEWGEDFLSTLQDLLTTYQISTGLIFGIGAFQAYSLGYYTGSTYKKIKANEFVEVLSIQGNLTLKDGRPFPHLHAIVGKKDGTTIGGHVLPGCIVSYTLEVVILRGGAPPLTRTFDERTSLYLQAPLTETSPLEKALERSETSALGT